MNDFNKEREYWKQLYENGEIDEETYYRNINAINMRNNLSSAKYYNMYDNDSNRTISLTPIIFIIIIIVGAFLFYQYKINKEVNKEYVTLNNTVLSEPEQGNASGSEVEVINNREVAIDYVASYKIYGRVVKTYSYSSTSIFNKLSPIDVGLTWGELAKDENNNNLTWSNSGDRLLHCNFSTDSSWYKNFGLDNIKNFQSNNHLIPSNDEIKKQINAIKEGDYIILTGYLVNIHYELDNGSVVYMNTSTTRTDEGKGACEIIYVTDVKWITDN